jgi:glycosyltransferase involved in cell wall biosynthesis
MKVTVILCTYNRCNSLRSALETLAAQAVPEDHPWEVLVVDNNSTDQTGAVAEEFCTRYAGRFRYLFEARQGKSFALNSGIEAAAGEILAFVDDDVTVEPEWLIHIVEALRDQRYDGVGGRIVPVWTCSKPRWLRMDGPYTLHGVLVAFELGDERCELTVGPFGANMAFRREVFKEHGGFRVDLGPTVGSEIRGEDSEFCKRVMSAGSRIVYEPRAIVNHPVPASRATKRYFEAWFYDHGRAIVRESGLPPASKCWFGVPRYMLRKLVIGVLKWWFAYRASARFYYKVRVWRLFGEIVEAHRQLQGEST